MYMKMSCKEAINYVFDRAIYEIGSSHECIEINDPISAYPIVYISAFGTEYRECVLWCDGTRVAHEIFSDTFSDIKKIAEEYKDNYEYCNFSDAYSEAHDEYWCNHDYMQIFCNKLGYKEWSAVARELAKSYVISHFDEEYGELEIPDEWEEFPYWKKRSDNILKN